MAHGITEAQVHAAADALVEAGDRPTVERIRAHLGTGSPNTVTRHLESWWSELGEATGAPAGECGVTRRRAYRQAGRPVAYPKKGKESKSCSAIAVSGFAGELVNSLGLRCDGAPGFRG